MLILLNVFAKEIFFIENAAFLKNYFLSFKYNNRHTIILNNNNNLFLKKTVIQRSDQETIEFWLK